jgi:serine/threonine-protein kinase RsbW
MRKELIIRSDPKNIKEIEHFVHVIFEHFKLDNSLYPNILISLTEAVNNAIIHGNNADNSKCVEIRSIIKDGLLSLRISDEGQGFCLSKIPDPTEDENLEKPNGRGVFLMKNLADKIHYSKNGSVVEISFTV